MSGTQSNSIARVYDSLSGRNRIINGNCIITQRAGATISGAATYAGPDRYYGVISGAGGSFTQAAGTITYNSVSKPAIVQTVTSPNTSLTGTNFWSGIIQTIEGVNSFDLLGQPISVSFIFNTNVAGTYSMIVRDNPNTTVYASTFTIAANTPTYFSFSIPSVPTSASVPASNAAGLQVVIGALNTGTYQSPASNTWTSGTVYISATGATNWGLVNGNFIAMTELQLEHGTIATPFEREPYNITLQKCQRYFCKNFPQGTAPANNAGQGNALFVSGTAVSTYWFAQWRYPVTMRSSPSILTYNYTTGTAGYWHDAAGGTDSQPGIVANSDSGCYVFLNNAAPFTAAAGSAWYINISANAEL